MVDANKAQQRMSVMHTKRLLKTHRTPTRHCTTQCSQTDNTSTPQAQTQLHAKGQAYGSNKSCRKMQQQAHTHANKKQPGKCLATRQKETT